MGLLKESINICSKSPEQSCKSLVFHIATGTWQRTFSVSIASSVEPKHYEKAVTESCWRDAISAELEALNTNKTWVITSLPPSKKPIGCKWVFKLKLKPDGSIERHKARLVAKGYNQRQGFDFFDTYSPIAKMTTLKILLALAVVKG
ncbi:uncharacterized mitochondrial protein AtMg00820-like [Arachis stenosperma]|uniref:uncharacterized mitochondrial protein AtMg00820-like n=1 Tax=Arachis stenosperma TaxID=217475 RepID=UPI0025AC7DD7|nr:uncharacterized mitochondrial protein AtMg00820-like [Arachis stenosperma]